MYARAIYKLEKPQSEELRKKKSLMWGGQRFTGGKRCAGARRLIASRRRQRVGSVPRQKDKQHARERKHANRQTRGKEGTRDIGRGSDNLVVGGKCQKSSTARSSGTALGRLSSYIHRLRPVQTLRRERGVGIIIIMMLMSRISRACDRCYDNDAILSPEGDI